MKRKYFGENCTSNESKVYWQAYKSPWKLWGTNRSDFLGLEAWLFEAGQGWLCILLAGLENDLKVINISKRLNGSQCTVRPATKAFLRRSLIDDIDTLVLLSRMYFTVVCVSDQNAWHLFLEFAPSAFAPCSQSTFRTVKIVKLTLRVAGKWNENKRTCCWSRKVSSSEEKEVLR